MIIVANRDVRVEFVENSNIVQLRIVPYDQQGNDAEPETVLVKYSTAKNLADALSNFIQLREN